MYMCVDLVSQNTEEVCKDLINFISRFAGPYLLLLFAACVTVLLADSHSVRSQAFVRLASQRRG